MTRPPCSERERAEADHVAARFRDVGYAVAVEPFETRPSAEPWLACYAGLSALAALLVYPLPLLAAIAGLAAVVLHARESDGRPLLTSRSCTSANVVARGSGAEPRLVIVTSPAGPRARLRALHVSLQTSMLAIPAAGAAAYVAEVEVELPASVAVAGVIAAVAMIALSSAAYRPRPDDPVPTALDVLEAVASRLRDQDVWFVVAGRDGISALLAEHPRELAGAAWLNLVPAPLGDVVAVSEEGSWRERRADRWLMGAAEEAGAEVRPDRVPTSATPLLARRRRALTLLVPPGTAGERIVTATALAALEPR